MGRGVVSKKEIYSGSSATQYYIRKSGQFIYGKLDFLNQAFGIIPPELDGYESTLDSPAFDLLKGINGQFLLEFVSRKEFYYYQGNIANGSRKAKRIHTETFLGMPISLPTLPEQEAIGNFFSDLDQLITLHQRKLDDVKELKKALLQKMFPKGNGNDFPELRFPEFTDAWKQRKLGEYFVERLECSAEGELLSVTISDGVRRFSELGRKDNSSEDKTKYKVLKQGDIVYNSMRMWQGASGYSIYDGIVSPAYTVLIPTYLSYALFFSYLFKRSSSLQIFQVNSQGLTSDTWNLKYKPFSNIVFPAPTLPEQEAIGSFFSDLDQLITLHQRK
ncbi:restriction endonuclease subunit S [Streptococcus suis]|uniref:restriction endonuclease subunit S n=1 Tax=Streptococcus suis TaxID=1307 RepID=UPI002AA583C6|nr:restriction endonuclease subunit S [Streptococcus suis]